MKTNQYVFACIALSSIFYLTYGAADVPLLGNPASSVPPVGEEESWLAPPSGDLVGAHHTLAGAWQGLAQHWAEQQQPGTLAHHTLAGAWQGLA